MEINNFKKQISDIIKTPSSTLLYLVLKVDGKLVLKLADVDNNKVEPEVTKLFKSFINEKILDNENIELCSLSEAEERPNAIYEYDYTTTPEELETIQKFSYDTHHLENNLFDFAKDDISNLYGYFVYLGTKDNGMYLFKKHYHISLIKRDSFLLGIKKSDKRFELIQGSDILRLNGNSQIIILNEKIFILDIKLLEKTMGFLELLQKDAEISIKTIEDLDLLEEVQVLRDSLDDISFTRKLARMTKTSPIFKLKITKKEIIEFSKNLYLKSKFKYTEDGKYIRLDTKKSKQDLLKLLNDSYLQSALTNEAYEAISKDTLSF